MTAKRDALIQCRTEAEADAIEIKLTGYKKKLFIWKLTRELYAIEMEIDPKDECRNCLGSGVVITPEGDDGYTEDNCDCVL